MRDNYEKINMDIIYSEADYVPLPPSVTTRLTRDAPKYFVTTEMVISLLYQYAIPTQFLVKSADSFFDMPVKPIVTPTTARTITKALTAYTTPEGYKKPSRQRTELLWGVLGFTTATKKVIRHNPYLADLPDFSISLAGCEKKVSFRLASHGDNFPGMRHTRLCATTWDAISHGNCDVLVHVPKAQANQRRRIHIKGPYRVKSTVSHVLTSKDTKKTPRSRVSECKNNATHTTVWTKPLISPLTAMPLPSLVTDQFADQDNIISPGPILFISRYWLDKLQATYNRQI